ncbi:hypothetical protein AKJ36_00655 [candidate division MSBL1 archaeon SCGC-AAA259I07]|uniref:Uncharacterized protein n=1 Tax=candidate division MSBL1 archaeon SCGC-AAA259I07 TaxID=1698266 RepID=A0A133UME6_9EURY|nr:hypothetical protein AKJ36_00655 [candidate division MSBL1 archaeon SCGC-AAA259I07]
MKAKSKRDKKEEMKIGCPSCGDNITVRDYSQNSVICEKLLYSCLSHSGSGTAGVGRTCKEL